MTLGKVVGSVVATRKNPNLVGQKLMIVKPLYGEEAPFVATDSIGAGIGEIVLVARGSAARCGAEQAPTDAAIVGIVDSTCDPEKFTL
jgi:ethanolamine utilization protein EutN